MLEANFSLRLSHGSESDSTCRKQIEVQLPNRYVVPKEFAVAEFGAVLVQRRSTDRRNGCALLWCLSEGPGTEILPGIEITTI